MGTRSAVGFALALMIAVGVLALGVALGSAATPPPTLTLHVVPEPTTAGEKVLSILKFSYAANASPTTLTGVYVDLEIAPALSMSTDFDVALSSDFCSLRTLSLVRCAVGNIRRGDSRTMFVVVKAPSGDSISMRGTAFWNENVNGRNPQPNNMIVSHPPEEDTAVVAETNVNAAGKCTVGGSTLKTGTLFGASNKVITEVEYHGNSQGLPCTPASVQDDVTITVPEGAGCTATPCLGSEIILPPMANAATSNRAMVTITFDSSLFSPPGPGANPNTFVLWEDAPGLPVQQVPSCPEATSFGTCKSSAVKFGARGVQVKLLTPGSGIDPKYFG